MSFHTNALILLGPKEDIMSKVLGHACSIASHANGWSNSFVPLLFYKLGINYSIRQDRYKRGAEFIQTRGFITLSAVTLSCEFLANMSDIIKGSSHGIEEVYS